MVIINFQFVLFFITVCYMFPVYFLILFECHGLIKSFTFGPFHTVLCSFSVLYHKTAYSM